MSFQNTIIKVKNFEVIKTLRKIPESHHEIKEITFNINNVCYLSRNNSKYFRSLLNA